jgi:hypothetical protein
MEEKIQCYLTNNHCFQYGNYAQIHRKKNHLLFVHNDNKSNSGKIGQVVMGGSEQNPRFLLVLPKVR